MRKAKRTAAEPPADAPRWELRGGNLALTECTDHEVVISGPRDTGKTIAACLKAHAYCSNTPGCQGAIVRKTQKSLAGTVLRTFERVVADQGVQTYGGASPERYIYPNGSVVWCGGMDNSDKVLSSERDFIYVNQSEELTLDDWEKLAGSCSGRGALVAYPQLFGDCNPGGSRHWIRERAKTGSLTLLVATHRDNPDLYTLAGEPTEGGKARMAVLDSLTGVRRLRLRDGVWATAEGAVYDTFNAAVHVKERPDGEMVDWVLCQDDGYTNPAVILLVGKDSDGRWHVFREWYERGKIHADVVAAARRWYSYPLLAARKVADQAIDSLVGRDEYKRSPESLVRCSLDAVDEAAAALVAALSNAGLRAVGGKGGIVDGIHKIQDRLKVQADGLPRLTVDPSCVNTQNEFESYVWKPEKDVPVDADNHALGALRYLQDVENEPTGAWTAADVRRQEQPAAAVPDDAYSADLSVS